MDSKKKMGSVFFCILLSSIILFSGLSLTTAHQIFDGKQYKNNDFDFIDSTSFIKNDRLVEKWDWRNVEGSDWTTPIRDQIQDQCGSCWAFGTLGGLEACYKIWKNDPMLSVDLSEQYILSCSPGGCDGWYLQSTVLWIKHHGMIFEDCMPYQADDTVPCEAKCEDWRETLFGITGYKKLPPRNIAAIQEALLTYGPLPATMLVYDDFYPEWDGGVYRYESGELVFGHVVTIVGYDDTWGDSDEGYWICKNSWGTEWGEEGWFRIAYGECNIENSVYYLENINYPPNKPEKPSGITEGNPETEYSFTTSCEDPDGHQIFYFFDWGDGNNSDWLGPVDSGVPFQVNYTWESEGTYPVKVKSMDFFGPFPYDYGIESEWSDPLEVSMPKNKESLYPIFSKILDVLIDRFPFLNNLIEIPN